MEYGTFIGEVRLEVGKPQEIARVSDEQIVSYIHRYMQEVSERSSIEEEIELELEVGEVDYELPPAPYEVKKVKHAKRAWGSQIIEVEFMDMEDLLNVERRDVFRAITYSPYIGAFWYRDGEQYLRLHPAPTEHLDEDGEPLEQTLNLYVHVLYLEHKLNDLYTDKNDELIFPPTYIDTLRYGVKAEVHRYLKDFPQYEVNRQLFERMLDTNNRKKQEYHRIQITYT
jgi:hypothetical protein